MFLGRRIIFGKLELQLTDALVLAALLSFSVLGLLFLVDGWALLILKNFAVGLLLLGAAMVTPRIQHRFWRFLVRVAAITLSYAYLFGAVDKLQLVFHSEWLDYYILDFEQWIFGFQPTLWAEKFTTPLLTETSMRCCEMRASLQSTSRIHSASLSSVALILGLDHIVVRRGPQGREGHVLG